MITATKLAKLFDHSLLQPLLTDDELAAGCRTADELGVATVCVKPYHVADAVRLLAGSAVAVGTVIGFPQGGHATAVKAFEAKTAIADGATELDMVVNLGWVASGDYAAVRSDIAAVVEVAHASAARVKVIFENAMLTTEQKVKLCEVCGELRADWVKTSTGYAESGATLADVKLMREHSPAWVQVKAAGGVRDLATLLAFRDAGVTRVGATATRAILAEAERQFPS